MDSNQLLRQVPVFAGLDEPDLLLIASMAHYKTYPANSLVVIEGEAGDSLYIILEGSAKVLLGNEKGREMILTIEGQGDYFGEIAVLDNEPRSASVMTLSRSRFMVIAGADLRAGIRSRPEIAFSIITGLTRRLRRLSHTVRGLALDNVHARVVSRIMELAHIEEGVQVIDSRPSQQILAEMVGASREMVGRILRCLVDAGYISLEGRRMVIHRSLPLDWNPDTEISRE